MPSTTWISILSLHDALPILQAIRRVAEWCRDLDVPLMSHYIIGFPWETPAHVTATLEMAWELYDRYGVWPSMQFATPILGTALDRKSTRLNSSHPSISYAVF